MLALRKLINKPKLTDDHPLAVFYYCDEAVNHQMQELNYLMKTTPDNLDRRATLIKQLKEAQHNLMNVIFAITQDAVPEHHTCRDFRAKYPDDILVDQINGPLWFGAECIAAGSHILNHELESEQLRPFAVQLSKAVSRVRVTLKEQCLTNRHVYSQKLKDMLKEFDVMWADFEFRYVGLMCNVKSERQYYHQQDVIVLFCESTLRALKREYIDHDMIEMMDPSIMFAIPRLAIVCGLMVCPDGPINPSRSTKDLPPFFRGYQTLLGRIKELLGYLTEEQLVTLEKALCTSEGLGSLNFTPSKTRSTKQSPLRPLSDATNPSPLTSASSVSPISPQSNPVTPNPPRRSVSSAQGVVSHQRSRSLGSHDLAVHTLENGDRLLSPPSPVATTTSCGGATAAESTLPPPGADGADMSHDSSSSSREPQSVSMVTTVECFPQFEPDQPVVNDLPMATPAIISPPLLPTQDNKHVPVSPAPSPSTRPKQSRKPGRRSSQRKKGPAGFASADDLMHRLFVAISGVADQLQTNHAKDLRVILKHVFAVCLSEPEPLDTESVTGEKTEDENDRQFLMESSPTLPQSLSNTEGLGFGHSISADVSSPDWVPDAECFNCTACHEAFSWKKRRHHCRGCGQVVCGRCSPHSLPRLHQLSPATDGRRRQRGAERFRKMVRVCNSCYLRQLGVAARISVTSHTPSSACPMEVL